MFNQVPVEGWEDYFTTDFDNNALFLSRVKGREHLEKPCLGALVLDSEQISHLLGLFDMLEKHFLFESDDVIINRQIMVKLEGLGYLMKEVQIERVEAHKQ